MLTIAEEPAIRRQMHPISVETYHRLGEFGLIPERVELIRGAIIHKVSQSPLHASIVELLRDHLTPQLPAGTVLRQEKPMTLAESEPEPDLAIVRGDRRDFRAAHPRTAELVIEVAVSSKDLDRLKLQLYAEAGVREAWLVIAEERTIERHTEPLGGGYQRVERSAFAESIPSTVVAGLTLPPPEL